MFAYSIPELRSVSNSRAPPLPLTIEMTVRVAGCPFPFHQEGNWSQPGSVAEARMVVGGAQRMISRTVSNMPRSRWMPMLGSDGGGWVVRWLGG